MIFLLPDSTATWATLLPNFWSTSPNTVERNNRFKFCAHCFVDMWGRYSPLSIPLSAISAVRSSSASAFANLCEGGTGSLVFSSFRLVCSVSPDVLPFEAGCSSKCFSSNATTSFFFIILAMAKAVPFLLLDIKKNINVNNVFWPADLAGWRIKSKGMRE